MSSGMKNNYLDKFKSYLVPVGSILAVLVMVPVFIMPQLTKIADASKVINKNQTRLDSIEKKATALEKLSKNQDSLEEKIAVIEKALPIDKSVAPLVSGIQQLAIESGLSVKSFKIQPGRTATESAKPAATSGQSGSLESQTSGQTSIVSGTNLVFQISLEGGTDAFKAFLATIEKAKRILVLEEFKSQSNDGKKFTFDIYLQAPYAPLPKLSDDQVGEPLPSLTVQNENLIEDLNSSVFQDVTQSQINPGPTGVVNPFE